ncbi:MAG TPA: TlpA disulfide reductase family protein [Saprospiraceae bacterium]|nr:TlpA disulfide reductase family protein [Saprospiraceae bacterium]HQW26155.1 TlpA disulfide reductase family protein [Saprospiraceae bacterium]
MKKLTILFAVLLATGNIIAQTWTWDREPEAGQNVNIQINDVPAEEGPLHAVVYYFDGTELVSNDVGMLPSDNASQIKMALAIHEHTSWVRVVVKNEFNQIGSADEKFVKNTSALPKAGLIEQALGSSVYARLLGIEANNGDVVTSFREAIKAYPQWLDNSEVYRSYYIIAKRAEATEDLAAIKAYSNSLAQKSNVTNEALMVNAIRATKDMGDSTLSMNLRKKLDKKYPKSILAQEEKLASFTKAATVEEKIKIRDQFKSQFPATKENTRMLDQMTSTLAQEYAGKEDWNKVKSYVYEVIDPTVRANVCNTYAWKLSGESIEAEAKNLDIAAALSASSLSLLSTDNPMPTGLTKKEWGSVMENNKAGYGDTYALILYKQGKYEEALTYQSFSVANNKYEDGEMNERYAVYLQKAGRTQDLEKFMDQIMVSGNATEKVKMMHKEHWTQTATKDQLYSQYLKQLENQAQAMREEKIMKTWESTDAPSFTLKDLNGSIVSLADYKGKTIVLDFWATWCGPCKASFPGMKKAVEHFASDQNVVFLFVDTWENGDNIDARVADFIKTNNYPFHVVMDSEAKVVNDYKVSGIPTKFIIGPDQKIRFTAVGYSGNNDELVEELKTMIQLVQENAGMQKS